MKARSLKKIALSVGLSILKREQVWLGGVRLSSLKLLSEKTASKVFQMFAEKDKASYAKAKAALKTRFRSVNIEELRGMELHLLVQGSESVDEFGMEIQPAWSSCIPYSGRVGPRSAAEGALLPGFAYAMAA